MAHHLLRNGSLISIEVEPVLLDVVFYRDFSGEFVYATLSEQAEFALLKSFLASIMMIMYSNRHFNKVR